MRMKTSKALEWRHNGHNKVSNHQPHDCLFNRLFRRRSKKTSKLRVTGFCAGNSPGTGEFPALMASNAENISIWWHHHGMFCRGLLTIIFASNRGLCYCNGAVHHQNVHMACLLSWVVGIWSSLFDCNLGNHVIFVTIPVNHDMKRWIALKHWGPGIIQGMVSATKIRRTKCNVVSHWLCPYAEG